MNEEKIYYNSTDNIKLCGLLSTPIDNDTIIILCHGLRGDKNENHAFTSLTEKLIENKINSFRFDFRSHGESTGLEYEMTISKEIEDLEATIKLLQQRNFHNFILLGASFGAGIIALINHKKYNITALISWYGALDFKHPANKTFSNANYEIAKQQGYYTRLKNNIETKFGLELFNEINTFKPYEQLSQLDLPILFIHGTSDTTIPYQLSQQVSSTCKNATLKLIENGSHTFNTSEEALQTAIKETINYLKTL